MEHIEKRIDGEIKYTGVIVNIRLDNAEIENGRIVKREVVEHPGGVAIVPVDENGNVLLVRQFRYPFMRELIEIPAGKLEPGEDPFECAKRELSEETGCTAGKYVYLGPMYSSPGFCEETLHVYLALDLTYGKMHLDEDEFLSVERVPMSKIVEMIMNNDIPDAKTVFGVLKSKLYLEAVE